MKIQGTPNEIIEALTDDYPEIPGVLAYVRKRVARIKREVDEFQAAALYVLAKQYDRPSAKFLEIGTAWGYSAAVQASAAPQADIATINPRSDENESAWKHLRDFNNVRILETRSWDYLAEYSGRDIDFMFVDGDHKRLRLDLPWWGHIAPGGTMLFHDYSPETSRRPCPVVFEILNEWRDTLGRDFDVSIIDDSGVGIVGYVQTSE